MFVIDGLTTLPRNIWVVGCGGTGSRIVQPLLQLIASRGVPLTTNVFLIDGDTVEAKNCTRQLFIREDIGYPKAKVLAERYQDLYPHINLVALTGFMSMESVLKPYLSPELGGVWLENLSHSLGMPTHKPHYTQGKRLVISKDNLGGCGMGNQEAFEENYLQTLREAAPYAYLAAVGEAFIDKSPCLEVAVISLINFFLECFPLPVATTIATQALLIGCMRKKVENNGDLQEVPLQLAKDLWGTGTRIVPEWLSPYLAGQVVCADHDVFIQVCHHILEELSSHEGADEKRSCHAANVYAKVPFSTLMSHATHIFNIVPDVLSAIEGAGGLSGVTKEFFLGPLQGGTRSTLLKAAFCVNKGVAVNETQNFELSTSGYGWFCKNLSECRNYPTIDRVFNPLSRLAVLTTQEEEIDFSFEKVIRDTTSSLPSSNNFFSAENPSDSVEGPGGVFAATVGLYNSFTRPDIIVMAVDSPEARRDVLTMASLFTDSNQEDDLSYNTIIVDPGNEDVFGQVTISTLNKKLSVPLATDQSTAKTKVQMYPKTLPDNGIQVSASHLNLLRNITYDIYGNAPHVEQGLQDLMTALPIRGAFEEKIKYVPWSPMASLLRAEGAVTLSCADMDQTLAINNLMAASSIGMLQNTMYHTPSTVETVRFNITSTTMSSPTSMAWFRDKMGQGSLESTSIVYLAQIPVHRLCSVAAGTLKDVSVDTLRAVVIAAYRHGGKAFVDLYATDTMECLFTNADKDLFSLFQMTRKTFCTPQSPEAAFIEKVNFITAIEGKCFQNSTQAYRIHRQRVTYLGGTSLQEARLYQSYLKKILGDEEDSVYTATLPPSPAERLVISVIAGEDCTEGAILDCFNEVVYAGGVLQNHNRLLSQEKVVESGLLAGVLLDARDWPDEASATKNAAVSYASEATLQTLSLDVLSTVLSLYPQKKSSALVSTEIFRSTEADAAHVHGLAYASYLLQFSVKEGGIFQNPEDATFARQLKFLTDKELHQACICAMSVVGIKESIGLSGSGLLPMHTTPPGISTNTLYVCGGIPLTIHIKGSYDNTSIQDFTTGSNIRRAAKVPSVGAPTSYLALLLSRIDKFTCPRYPRRSKYYGLFPWEMRVPPAEILRRLTNTDTGRCAPVFPQDLTHYLYPRTMSVMQQGVPSSYQKQLMLSYLNKSESRLPYLVSYLNDMSDDPTAQKVMFYDLEDRLLPAEPPGYPLPDEDVMVLRADMDAISVGLATQEQVDITWVR
jgi:hypothetical protein